MLVTPYTRELRDFNGPSGHPRSALATLGTPQRGGPRVHWNPVVPSHGVTNFIYRLDAEARCLREHCNPSGPWNVASRAQRGRYPQAPRVQCRVDTELPRLTDLDLRIWLVARIQTDSNGRGPRISTAGPIAARWRWTLLYQAVSYFVEVRRLSRDFLQLLTVGFNVATPSASAYSTCPAFYSHSAQNRLFRAENHFSGVEFCTGNLLQTPIDTSSEVSIAPFTRTNPNRFGNWFRNRVLFTRPLSKRGFRIVRVNGQALCKAVCTATWQVKEVSKWNTTVTTKTNREDGDIYSQDRRALDGQT